MSLRSIWIAAIQALFIIAASAGCDDDVASSGPAPGGTRRVVLIRDNYFTPAVVTVKPGDAVEWINIGWSPHTVSSGDNCNADSLWADRRLESGEAQRLLLAEGFDTLSTIGFHCSDHCGSANMRGLIVVEH
jgi:plastocyanin